jgi:hypothetical protein
MPVRCLFWGLFSSALAETEAITIHFQDMDVLEAWRRRFTRFTAMRDRHRRVI